ncbi:MAG TPA: YncE family protein [Rhizomicrobium sp.]|jgi:YVTN family beta-propeller protein
MLTFRHFAIPVAALAICTLGVTESADAAPSYKIVKSIALGGPNKWDFVEYDPATGHVLVSHRTKVDVVDVSTGKIVGEVTVGESHGVVSVPALGRGYADDAAAKTLVAFDLKTLKTAGTAPVGVDADAVTYDPATGRVFVMNADGNSASAVDAKTMQALKTVPLSGAPEMAVVDGKGKLFINIASTNEIVVFDTKSLAIMARWPVPACTSPHGLAMDTQSGILFASCKNDKMIAVDAASGKTIGEFPIGKGTDSAAFDPVKKLAYSANGDGTLSVIEEKDPHNMVALGDAVTAPGARTMALDPKTGRVFLVTADVDNTLPPETPGSKPHYTFKPDSVKLLVLEPQK